MTRRHFSAFIEMPETLRLDFCRTYVRMFGLFVIDLTKAKRWWGEAPVLPQTERKAT
jgi:hypothetical protein